MPPVITPFPSALLVTVTSVSLPVMVTTESSPKPVKVFPFKSSVIDLLILMFSVTSFASTTVSPFSAFSIAFSSVSYCVPLMVAACFTSPVVSPLLSSLFSSLPSEGVVLPAPSSVPPPPTVGVKVSSLPFCPSPEGVGVPSVPEGGAVGYSVRLPQVCLLVLFLRCCLLRFQWTSCQAVL